MNRSKVEIFIVILFSISVQFLFADDCAGVPNGDNVEDNCGTCDNDPSNDCVQDCAGIWGGDLVFDACGDCGGDDSCCSIQGSTHFIPAYLEKSENPYLAMNIYV